MTAQPPTRRRPPWLIREDLRGLFLLRYDEDAEFQTALHALAANAEALALPSDEPLESLPIWAAAMLEDTAAALITSYCARVRELAADVGLIGLRPLPGILHSDGPGLIHAWCTRRPHPEARFSRSPFERGGMEPMRIVSIQGQWDPSFESLDAFHYRLRAEVDREVQRLRADWRTGTRSPRRRNQRRDAAFLFDRVRGRQPWSRVGRRNGGAVLSHDQIRKATQRFAAEIGMDLSRTADTGKSTTR